MIQLETHTQTRTTTAISTRVSPYLPAPKRQTYWLKIGLCLLLACLGASWFAYQYFLVAQPAQFVPPWQGAQWVQASDGTAPVAYFRYTTDITTIPDAAFITIAASQSFRLYVNGFLVSSNAADITRGNGLRAYIFDIVSALHTGSNVMALRVVNLDQQAPMLRATIGLIHGSSIAYSGTDTAWHATTQTSLVYYRHVTDSLAWTSNSYDDSTWRDAGIAASPAQTPLLAVNPLLYKQPLAAQWMSAGANHNAYFLRTLTLPSALTGVWLRVVATGPAQIFINGHLSMVWNGQAPVPQQQLADYLSDEEITPQYQSGLVVGIYDITPYLQAGNNTIAVHVSSPSSAIAQQGLDSLNSALAIDALISDTQGRNNWVHPDLNWHASSQAVASWQNGSNAALSWPSPYLVGRPGVSRALYLPYSPTPRNVIIPSFEQLGLVIILSVVAVLGLWLFMSLFVLRRYYSSRIDTFEKTCLAYLPAVACEGLLMVLAREPQIPQPFPYTSWWGLLLLACIAAGYLLVWLSARKAPTQPDVALSSLFGPGPETPLPLFLEMETPLPRPLAREQGIISALPGYRSALLDWLRAHWGLVLIVLLSLPLIFYDLTYEPYWQDELTSYFAAKGILAHGLPTLPSGFLYLKAELYSYFLALSIAIFGEQNGALRIPTVLEYLVSLPIFYGVACSLFNRRIAFFATAMLAFSPSTLLWSHQVRMYEQAQLFTILVMYLFYRAIQQPEKPSRIYLAVACLVATYLSHEETFIILPALVLCVLLTSRDAARPLPAVLYQKHWWIASMVGACMIGLQLVLTKITHPPVLGTDQSQQPLIQLTTENIPYYVKLFFDATAINPTLPWLGLNSVLAAVGGFLGVHRGDKPAIYCGLLFLVSLLTLIFLFTLTSDRYVYPLLPAFYLLGAYALVSGLNMTQVLVRSRPSPHRNERTYIVSSKPPLPLRVMVTGVTTLVCACVLLLPLMPLSNSNLFISRQLGLLYHRHYPDYDAVNEYMQQHWRQGDIVIAVSPAISILYYVGHVDYFFSVDRALYLFEHNGQVVDTPTGTTPLLSQADFQAVLAIHARVWIVSDNGLYQAGVMKNNRFVFPDDFHLVSEGYGSAVYFRGG